MTCRGNDRESGGKKRRMTAKCNRSLHGCRQYNELQDSVRNAVLRTSNLCWANKRSRRGRTEARSILSIGVALDPFDDTRDEIEVPVEG